MRRQLRIAARSLVPLIGCLVCLAQAPPVMLAAEPTNNIKGSGKMPTVHGLEPCCAITNIAGSLVTAKDNTSGKTFQFQATNQALAKSLRVGQTVYADFGTQQVSVDGAAPCCGIMSSASSASGATAPSGQSSASPVTPEKKQTPSVKPGTTQAPSPKVPAAKTSKKRKDPKANCIGLGCGENEPPCIGLGCGEKEPICVGMGCEKKDAAIPNEGGPTGAAKLPSVQKPTVHGAEPCCNITSIAANGLVTAKDNTTDKTFQFQATNQALAKSLRVGQTIYANFGTQQVSVDGATPCCGIVSGASATTGVPTIR